MGQLFRRALAELDGENLPDDREDFPAAWSSPCGNELHAPYLHWPVRKGQRCIDIEGHLARALEAAPGHESELERPGRTAVNRERIRCAPGLSPECTPFGPEETKGISANGEPRRGGVPNLHLERCFHEVPSVLVGLVDLIASLSRHRQLYSLL